MIPPSEGESGRKPSFRPGKTQRLASEHVYDWRALIAQILLIPGIQSLPRLPTNQSPGLLAHDDFQKTEFFTIQSRSRSVQ